MDWYKQLEFVCSELEVNNNFLLTFIFKKFLYIYPLLNFKVYDVHEFFFFFNAICV